MASDDALVIGGGAFGLWTALACLDRGLRVTVADAGRVGGGGGASATPIGALGPHLASSWTPLKALQLEALAGMAGRLGRLEARTGLSCGYARLGRAQPLDDPAARDRAQDRAAEATARWARSMTETSAPRMWVEARGQGVQGWLAPPRHGVLRDDLTARLDARATLAALREALERGGATLLDGWTMRGLTPGGARFDQGERRAGAVVLAGGWRAFDALGRTPLPALEPEHGQAARLACAAPPGAPIVGAQGLWIVPQADGTVAVGATSERGRRDLRTDAALDKVLARAAALVPALKGAEVIERWAGLRPRLATRAPLVGRAPGRPGVWVAAGGFKIGLALAPVLGEGLAAMIAGAPARLPAEVLTGEAA